MGLKAYLLWESNGKPDGGDFSGQARAELETELRRGMSLQELERRLKTVRENILLQDAMCCVGAAIPASAAQAVVTALSGLWQWPADVVADALGAHYAVPFAVDCTQI